MMTLEDWQVLQQKNIPSMCCLTVIEPQSLPPGRGHLVLSVQVTHWHRATIGPGARAAEATCCHNTADTLHKIKLLSHKNYMFNVCNPSCSVLIWRRYFSVLCYCYKVSGIVVAGVWLWVSGWDYCLVYQTTGGRGQAVLSLEYNQLLWIKEGDWKKWPFSCLFMRHSMAIFHEVRWVKLTHF